MNKQIRTFSRFPLLFALTLVFGCAQPAVTDSPTQTPIPSPVFTKTQPFLTSTNKLAATKERHSIPSQIPDSECLAPLVNFSFPVGTIHDLGNVVLRPDTLPSNGWQAQIDIPLSSSWLRQSDIGIVDDEIWILDNGHNRPGVSKVILYTPTNNQIRIIQGDSRNPVFDIERLLVTKNGSVWKFGNTQQSLLISKYKSSDNEFQLIKKQDEIAQKFIHIMDVKEDPLGYIWILERQTGLYRFDPQTNSVDFLLPIANEPAFGHIVPVEGSIWILVASKPDSHQAKLQRYFPETNELKNFEGTPSISPSDENLPNLSISSVMPLFLDESNRLWVGNAGWLNNPDSTIPSWNRILPNPIFINAYLDGVGGFFVVDPQGMSQSSDGMFWFWALGFGTVRLNPEIGEWCLFTTYSSPVVEDSNHNLWMVAGNKLYKYQLPQK